LRRADVNTAEPHQSAGREAVNAGRGDGPESSPRLVGPELVVHMYAPVEGARLGPAHGYLRDVWARCREHFSMNVAVAGTDLPTGFPSLAFRRLDSDVLAAQESQREGVYQTILRLDHDLLCLSAILAPPPRGDGCTWASLDTAWETVAGRTPSDLVGAARIYQGYVAGLGELSNPSIDATPSLVQVCEGMLPPDLRGGQWAGNGLTTGGGFAVWEADRRQDDRLERRLIVLAPADRNSELSCWTWARDDHDLPALQSYLGDAAKIRYQWRVWAGGKSVRRLYARADARVEQLRGLGKDLDTPMDEPTPSASGARGRSLGLANADTLTARLRSDAADLQMTSARLRLMRQSVQIAAANMRAVLADDGTTPTNNDAFGDDLGLADHIVTQLDADIVLLSSAHDRADAVLGLVVPSTAGQATATGLTSTNDMDMTLDQKRELAREIATVFGTGAAVARLLEEIGFPPALNPNAVGLTPLDWWTEILQELDHGIVYRPYRRLLAAALRQYPHNSTFRRLVDGHAGSSGSVP